MQEGRTESCDISQGAIWLYFEPVPRAELSHPWSHFRTCFWPGTGGASGEGGSVAGNKGCALASGKSVSLT